MKIAKADLVPTDTNLREQYASFAELEAACEAFCDQVNARVHRVTRRAPAEMLAEERARLHPVPAAPHTVAFGETRTVAANTPMVVLRGRAVLGAAPACSGRRCGCGCTAPAGTSRSSSCTSAPTGPVEVARHARATPGSPKHRRRRTSRPPRPGRCDREPQARQRRRGRVPRARRRCPAVVERGRRRGHHEIRVKMAARRDDREAVETQPRSTGRSGTPRSTAGSPRPTWPRSWTTTAPPPGPAAVTAPGRTAP